MLSTVLPLCKRCSRYQVDALRLCSRRGCPYLAAGKAKHALVTGNNKKSSARGGDARTVPTSVPEEGMPVLFYLLGCWRFYRRGRALIRHGNHDGLIRLEIRTSGVPLPLVAGPLPPRRCVLMMFITLSACEAPRNQERQTPQNHDRN